MQSRLRIGGQPVQPLLLMFPLGLFVMAILFDLASLLGAPPIIGTLAFYNLVAGLAGGLLAVLACGYDAFGARHPDAARVAFLSLLLDAGVLIWFAVLTLMRVRSHDRLAGPGLLSIEVLGLAAAFFGAWYGGRFTESPAPAPRVPAPSVATPRPRVPRPASTRAGKPEAGPALRMPDPLLVAPERLMQAPHGVSAVRRSR